MGDSLLGRYAKVKIGTETVANIASWKIDVSTTDIDASVFGTGWGATKPGMQKWTAVVEGFLDMADITGQLVLKNAQIGGTKIANIGFYQDSTSYWAPNMTADSGAGAYILSMSMGAANNDIIRVTFNVGGVGPLTLI